MHDFNVLDSSSFRPFCYAAETLNFTQAARKAGLTQSGVSQHIAKLEKALGVTLFKRISKRVILTDAGRRLKAYVEKFVEETEALKSAISNEVNLPEGTVSYAMPASCLMSPHFPLLLQARNEKFPGIELKVTLCPSDEVIHKLLNAEIDFGFVTKNTGHPSITFLPFCPEEYILVGTSAKVFASISPKTLAEERFLGHPGVEVLFGYWVAHHFPRLRLSWDALNVACEINSLNGVIDMLLAGMGISVLPRHCVATLLEKKKLFEFTMSKLGPLLAQIYIVTLVETSRPRKSQVVIDAFLQMKKAE